MVDSLHIHYQNSELFETHVERDNELEGIRLVYFVLDSLSLLIFHFLAEILFFLHMLRLCQLTYFQKKKVSFIL